LANALAELEGPRGGGGCGCPEDERTIADALAILYAADEGAFGVFCSLTRFDDFDGITKSLLGKVPSQSSSQVAIKIAFSAKRKSLTP